jgi:flavin-dependent dehydrogenase
MTQAEVLVIGGGPAGSTAGALLAEAGVDVAVIEKEHFPRFHIGESLLSLDMPILKRLRIPTDTFLYKAGARFIDERIGATVRFNFCDALPERRGDHAWQVERAVFDNLIMNAAKERGARVFEGRKVVGIDVGADRVTVETEEKERFHGRYLVDATGQDAILGRKAKSVVPFKGIGRAGVFCHFHGLSKEAQEEFCATGDTNIIVLPDSWTWHIPLTGGRLSCGVVTSRKGVDLSLFEWFMAQSPMTRRLTQGTHQTPRRIIRNYSYFNSLSHGARFTCVGDAAAFLDPLFSSGVSLAMVSGEKMAEILIPALREGREAEPQLMDALSGYMDISYRTFGELIWRYYNTGLVHRIFFQKPGRDIHRPGISSVVSGDMWRDDNPFQKLLLGARRASFAGAQRGRADGEVADVPAVPAMA